MSVPSEQNSLFFAFIQRHFVQPFSENRLHYVHKILGPTSTDLVSIKHLSTVCFNIPVYENVYLCEAVNRFELE